MDILVIALSINPQPLSAHELKLSGLIIESWVDTVGNNQNVHVIISNYIWENMDKKLICTFVFAYTKQQSLSYDGT